MCKPTIQNTENINITVTCVCIVYFKHINEQKYIYWKCDEVIILPYRKFQ